MTILPDVVYWKFCFLKVSTGRNYRIRLGSILFRQVNVALNQPTAVSVQINISRLVPCNFDNIARRVPNVKNNTVNVKCRGNGELFVQNGTGSNVVFNEIVNYEYAQLTSHHLVCVEC